MHLVSPVSIKQSLQEGLRNKVAYLSCQWTAYFFPLTVAARSLPSLQTLLCLPLYLLNGTLFYQPHLRTFQHPPAGSDLLHAPKENIYSHYFSISNLLNFVYACSG